MNGRTRLAAMATAVVLACLPASARADISGNDLWNWCNSKVGIERGLCYGYVLALAEAERQPEGLFNLRNCAPADITRQQLVDIVKQSLDRAPKERHLHASTLVALALAVAFPCKP